MNEAIELHDSKLSAVVAHRDAVAVQLQPAYIHRSAGEAAKDAGTGWLQSATLTFIGLLPFEVPARLPTTLWGGSLRIDDHLYENVIPSTGEFSGDIQFTVDTNNDESMKIHGNHLRIELHGEATYVEDFLAC
jgi:hypothetical protein